MTPYYSDDAVTIYHGDCRDILPTLDLDVVVTDPPYGTGYYDTDTAVMSGDLLRFLVDRSATCAVFGWPERLVEMCCAAGVSPDEWVTWWPTNAAVRASPVPFLLREVEAVAVFGDVAGFGRLRVLRSESSRRLVSADYQGVSGKQRGTSHGELDTRQAGDVWRDPAPGLAFQSHLRLHPNEKPVSLMQRLVEAMPSGVIVDPFVGSGTTLRAAKDLGRRAIGIELDESYCEIAAKRLAQEVLAF